MNDESLNRAKGINYRKRLGTHPDATGPPE
jgi:hypothetical protein